MFSENWQAAGEKKIPFLEPEVCSKIMMFTACIVLKKGLKTWTELLAYVMGIKWHPCDPNEATQLANYLVHY